MTSTAAGPLSLPRLTLYALVIAVGFTVIGTSAWALSELQDKKDKLKSIFSNGHLDAGDDVACSAVAVAFAGISIAASLAWFAASAIPRLRSCDNTKRGLTYQFFFFAFMEVAWFAIGVASAVVVATRKAKINVPGISDNLIDRALSATGESTAYKDNDPSVAYVICIWLAFLINTITLITVFLASKRASETTHSGPDALTGERDIKEPHTKETSAA